MFSDERVLHYGLFVIFQDTFEFFDVVILVCTKTFLFEILKKIYILNAP